MVLEAGRVGRAHGLDGSFYVTHARPLLLALGTPVVLEGSPRAIVRRAGTDRRPIVRVDGCTDRSSAEALRGAPLLVAEQDAPALVDGEWWPEQLEGCRVVDGTRAVGIVARLVALPSCECLAVRRSDGGGGELLVPLVGAAIRRVDVERREIDVALSFLGEQEPAS
ncbi:MAG: ribosome maturation factor RimM [Solirubrobacteraceae bacterium]